MFEDLKLAARNARAAGDLQHAVDRLAAGRILVEDEVELQHVRARARIGARQGIKKKNRRDPKGTRRFLFGLRTRQSAPLP